MRMAGPHRAKNHMPARWNTRVRAAGGGSEGNKIFTTTAQIEAIDHETATGETPRGLPFTGDDPKMARQAVLREIFLKRLSQRFKSVNDHRLSKRLVTEVASSLFNRGPNQIHIQLPWSLDFEDVQTAAFHKI